jgi:hypothetical protein
MKLVRKWHPDSSPYINNEGGPKVFRIVALVKDETFNHYVCFYDSYTSKVYIESARVKHSTSSRGFDHKDLYQVKDDKEWGDVIAFLKRDDIEVLQMVENSYEVGTGDNEGEVTLHENLNKLPRVPYGVDSNGSQVITRDTPIEAQISPSLLGVDGKPLTKENMG